MAVRDQTAEILFEQLANIDMIDVEINVIEKLDAESNPFRWQSKKEG